MSVTTILAERRAQVTWENDLIKGKGTLRFGSGAVPELPVTWASRTERSDGKTSPEELLAAAHASCYAMALSSTLARNGTTPTRLEVTAECALDKVGAGPKVTMMNLTVTGQVQGINQSQFQQAANDAEKVCPISNAIRNNVTIKLTANLA